MHSPVVELLAAQAGSVDLGLVRTTLQLLEAALGRSDLVSELERVVERARR